MSMLDVMKHPVLSARASVHRLQERVAKDDDTYLYAESHGALNEQLPLDREYLARMARQRANDERVERLQALPGLPADPVQ